MENFKSIPGGICAPAGFSAAGVHCGIRHNHSKLDLALIKADVRCAGAGCYTTNKVYGAPITVDREHLKDGYAQAIVVNSGNANTCAPNGIELAKETCEIVAKELGISADDVLPSSTGVIGQAMSIEPFAKGIPEAAAKLAATEAGSHDAYYEWLSVAAILPMALYNGQRGSGHKLLFYWFYPAHIYLLYAASCLVYTLTQ